MYWIVGRDSLTLNSSAIPVFIVVPIFVWRWVPDYSTSASTIKGSPMETLKLRLIAWLGLLASVSLMSSAQAQVTTIAGSNADAYFGSLNDTNQVSDPIGFNPWAPAGPNPPAFYSTINQLPGVPSPPTGSTAPSNVSPFFPFNSTSFFNDGFGNTASSAISGFVTVGAGTADDAQVGLFMTLNQTTGGYAYEQLNYVIDYNVSSLVNTIGTAGTIAGLVTRSYSISGIVNSTAGFVAFGGEMSFWDGTTNTSLGAPLLFNYFNATPGPYNATVSASSFINAVNFPNVLRVTGNFFVVADPSSITVNSIPEPSTLVLGAVGVLVMGLVTQRKRFRSM